MRAWATPWQPSSKRCSVSSATPNHHKGTGAFVVVCAVVLVAGFLVLPHVVDGAGALAHVQAGGESAG